jgi:hypothetical protein
MVIERVGQTVTSAPRWTTTPKIARPGVLTGSYSESAGLKRKSRGAATFQHRSPRRPQPPRQSIVRPAAYGDLGATRPACQSSLRVAGREARRQPVWTGVLARTVRLKPITKYECRGVRPPPASPPTGITRFRVHSAVDTR